MLAHASGLINTWGFAYTGGVIGTFSTALWLVHHDLRQRAATRDGSNPAVRLPRWLVLVGLICGISIGLGVGKVLNGMIHDDHTPASTSPTAATDPIQCPPRSGPRASHPPIWAPCVPETGTPRAQIDRVTSRV